MPCFLADSSAASLLSKSPIKYFWPSLRAKPITRNLPTGALSCSSSTPILSYPLSTHPREPTIIPAPRPQQNSPAFYALAACRWALILAHRVRCAAAILFRAARLIRRAGLWAGSAFALGFIFPCAQRCFSSRDIFLRAAALILRTGLDARACFAFAHRARWAAAIRARPAALMLPRLRAFRAALGGRPTLRRPVEFRPSIALIARSMRSRSAFSSVTIC